MMTSEGFRTAYVYIHNIYAGELKETEDGYYFQYNSHYIENNNEPASLTLPIKKEPYISKTLFSFFDGLIPEGWLLNIISKNWKININDRFGLLLCSCQDAIGAVTIQKEYKGDYYEE